MESEGYQKELFEFEEKSRKQFPQFEKMLPKADFEGKIAFTFGMDRIIFISMGIMLIMVVVFAIGVERGRSIEAEAISRIKSKAVVEQAQQIQPLTASLALQESQGLQAPAPQKPVVATPKIAVPTKAPVASQAKPNTAGDIGLKPYTIVAGSFKGRDAGQLAVNRLKKEGFDAYLTQNDAYFVVCVGGYSNRTAAQSTFTKVKRAYKDAYIKLR